MMPTASENCQTNNDCNIFRNELKSDRDFINCEVNTNTSNAINDEDESDCDEDDDDDDDDDDDENSHHEDDDGPLMGREMVKEEFDQINSFIRSDNSQINVLSHQSMPHDESIANKVTALLGANFPDDSKLLANPKGIIKSYLPIAAAGEPEKFDSYRKLCMAHVNEYYRHQKGDNGALCLVCNVQCQHWNTLQRHLQTHINFRPFACEACGRTFYSQSKLKRHQIIHSDVKPYKCPVCDRRLGRTEHLKRHLLVHTDNKPYGCSSCNHTTKRLDGIRRHIKRKHINEEAKIIELDTPMQAQLADHLRSAAMALASEKSNLDASQITMTPKTKKKKKKKKAPETPPAYSVSCNNNQLQPPSSNQKEIMGEMFSERVENNQITREGSNEKEIKSPMQSCSQKSLPQTPDDKKLIWDKHLLMPSYPVHLLYQKLAHTNNARDSSAAASNNFPPHSSTPNSEDTFAGNQARYLPTNNPANISSHNINTMLLSSGPSNHTLGHYPYSPDMIPTEVMISQYFQSHQRFSAPVWGFTNPNYPNY